MLPHLLSTFSHGNSTSAGLANAYTDSQKLDAILREPCSYIASIPKIAIPTLWTSYQTANTFHPPNVWLMQKWLKSLIINNSRLDQLKWGHIAAAQENKFSPLYLRVIYGLCSSEQPPYMGAAQSSLHTWVQLRAAPIHHVWNMVIYGLCSSELHNPFPQHSSRKNQYWLLIYK